MHALAMLKWTATILLVFISECHGHSTCVYSFHVPDNHEEAGCPGNGQSSEMLRLAESLAQVNHVVYQLTSAFEVLQVIMRSYLPARPTFVFPWQVQTFMEYISKYGSRVVSILLVSHCGEYMANGLTNAIRHQFAMIAK